MKKICVLGSINQDIIINAKRLPLMGESMIVDGLNYENGGKGANQAMQLKKLDADVSFIAAIGNDAFANQQLNNLIKHGFNQKDILNKEGSTGLGIVHLCEDGNVYASIVEGANGLFSKADIDSYLDTINDSAYLLIQLELKIEIIEYLVSKVNPDIKIVLNAAPAKELSETLMKRIDLLIVNEVEASFYAGINISDKEEAKQSLVILEKYFNADIIITLGGKGLVYSCGNEINELNSYPVHVIDSTGAGDSFCGTLVYAMANDYDFTNAITYANASGALATTKIGPQCSQPTLEEIKTFIEHR